MSLDFIRDRLAELHPARDKRTPERRIEDLVTIFTDLASILEQRE